MQVTRQGLARFFDVVLPHMNERQRRVVAGAAVELLGRGAKTAVAEAAGMSRNTGLRPCGTRAEPQDRMTVGLRDLACSAARPAWSDASAGGIASRSIAGPRPGPEAPTRSMPIRDCFPRP